MKAYLSLVTLALAITAALCVPAFRKTTACENHTASLKCKDGYGISIIMAKYGRADHATCPSKAIKTTYCSSRESLSIVKRSCNGRQSCKVLASNNVFGDPCRGTYKYLSIRYECKKIAPAGIRRSITCERKEFSLSCPSGKVLAIVSANYGRSDPNTCYSKSMKTTQCSSSKSFHVVKDRCQGQKSCSFYASNSVFGDPCIGTYKYLDVKYRCVAYQKPETYTKTICESKSVTIECPPHMRLYILFASYGRTDGYTCRKYGLMSDTSCSAPGCTETIRKHCRNERSCTIKATNSMFGDPCIGTYKYLTLKYKCAY